MRRGQQVFLVIPARNEAKALPRVLARVPPWVDRVVVVDNASSDETAHVARGAGADVVSEVRLGYGAACATGVRRCFARGAEIIAFLDADGSDDPRELERVVTPIAEGGVDFVVGCRSNASMAFHQRLGTRLVCLFLSLGFRTRVSDLGPFRAIRADLLRRLELRDRAFGWTAEMQARAMRLGVRVHEVPVSWSQGQSRSEISGTVKGSLRAGRDLLWRAAREIVGARLDGLRGTRHRVRSSEPRADRD